MPAIHSDRVDFPAHDALRGGRPREFASSATQDAGFTLLELMIVAAIVAILASIAVPLYQGAVGTARVQKAKQELRLMSTDIDSFRATHFDRLPLTLADVGHGGRLDPWGLPYCFLNFQTGTGDGFAWAVEVGLVNPAAIEGDTQVTVVAASTRTIFDRVTNGQPRPVGVLPAMPPVTANTVKRRDGFLFPLNSDYDLFSLGSNRSTNVTLGDRASLDDVIRANDGGFFGVASEY